MGTRWVSSHYYFVISLSAKQSIFLTYVDLVDFLLIIVPVRKTKTSKYEVGVGD